MARREVPLDPSESPLHAFAQELRMLRDGAGLTYRAMATRSGFGRSTLAEAANGRTLPTLEVTLAYVGVCGGDQEQWSRRWHEVRATVAAQRAADDADNRFALADAEVPPADRPLVDLLAAVHSYWIAAELSRRLKLTGRLPVRLVEYREPPQPLPEDVSVRELYRQSPHLLVLGEPGTGKTILLQELAKQLIDDWAEDFTQPVPVIVPLSSWAQHRPPLETWLVEELYRLYSVDHELAWRWVRARRLLPLLDGLDEVPTKHRDACVAAINYYRRSRGAVRPLVVTCRTEVYQSLQTPMRPRRTVEVQRLSTADVRRHVRAAGREFATVRDALEHDPELAEMATTPLFLAMITYTYRGRTPPPDARHTLFTDYVTRRLRDEFPGKPELAQDPAHYPEDQVLHRLSWLARSMRRHNQTVFHPDLMQPDLLADRRHRWLVRPGVAIITGLTLAVLFGLIFWIAFDTISTPRAGRPHAGIAAGAIGAALAGLACGAQCLRRTIEPTRPPNRSVSELRRVLTRAARWAAAGAVIGAPVGGWFGYLDAQGALGFASYAVVGLLGATLGGTPGGMTLGALLGLALGIVNSLRTEPNVRPARPGIGMRETAHMAMMFGGSPQLSDWLRTAYWVGFRSALWSPCASVAPRTSVTTCCACCSRGKAPCHSGC